MPTLTCATGAFALTGNAVTLSQGTSGYTLNAGSGSFAVNSVASHGQ